MRRKEESSKQGQTNNKAKQHSTPKAVTFPRKNELPRVGLEPTTLYTLDRAHVHVHVLMRDEKEGRKKQARSNKQQGKLSNTAHPRQSHEHVVKFVALPISG